MEGKSPAPAKLGPGTRLDKYGDAARPLTSLGYKQAVQLLRGGITPDAAVQATQQAHRNYAKRQMTWFRREPDVAWFAGFGHDPGTQQIAIDLVQARCKTDI